MLCADHHYLFHELFVKLYLAKDRKPLPFKPKDMVQLIRNNEDQVGSEDSDDEPGKDIEYDPNSAKEIVFTSLVKLQQGRKTTKRLVDELDEHINYSKGKKRKFSKAKKVAVKNVT